MAATVQTVGGPGYGGGKGWVGKQVGPFFDRSSHPTSICDALFPAARGGQIKGGPKPRVDFRGAHKAALLWASGLSHASTAATSPTRPTAWTASTVQDERGHRKAEAHTRVLKCP